MNNSKGKIQVGIYLIAILMMGVVGIASSMGVVAAHFPEVSMTNIQVGLISVPCIVIMVVTLLMGKLMQVVSKKVLTLVAIVLFLVGGIAPAFMSSFSAIMVLRGVFGAGVGALQVVSTALVAENFEGAEREKVQGNLQAFQMLGCAIMVFVGGWLGAMGWNVAFYVHALAIVSLVATIICIPNIKPAAAQPAKAEGESGEKAKLTGKMWVWMVIAFFVFATGQIFSNSNAFLVEDLGIGDSAASGLGMAFFCAGGILMGLLYGKVAQTFGRFTMAVGFFVMAIAYVIMAVSPSIIVFYIGCLVFGLGMSIVMPNVFLNVGTSVAPAAVGMALSIATCVQNFGQFCSPYIVNPITAAVGGTASVVSFYTAAALGAVLGVALVIKALAEKKEVKA